MSILATLLLPLVLSAASVQGPAPVASEVRLAPPVLGLAFARDGRLAVCDADGLRLADPRTGAETVLSGAHVGAVAAAAAADVLAAVDADGDVAVWNAVSGERVAVLSLSSAEGFEDVQPAEVRLRLSNDGERVTAWRPGGAAVEIAVAAPEEARAIQAKGPDVGARVRAVREVSSRLVVTPPASAGEAREYDLRRQEPTSIALDPVLGRVAWTTTVGYQVSGPGEDSKGWGVVRVGEHGKSPEVADLAFDDRGRLLVLWRGAPDGWKLEVVSESSGDVVGEVALGAAADDLVLSAAANAPRFLIARVDDRIDVYDAETLEVSYTMPIATAPNPAGETFRRDVFGISNDGEVMAMSGDGGAVLFATTGPGFFMPTTLRLPREAGLPYSLRFDPSLLEVIVGCRGASPGAAAREWVGTLETENFAAGWTPTAADPARHPYAWSADGATRAEVLAEVEWRVTRRGEGGWSRAFGARAVAALGTSESTGLVAVALEGDASVRFLSFETGAILQPGKDD